MALRRRELPISAALLLASEMPGSLSYVIAKDAADENTLWVTEVWNSEADHAASLTLPAVKEAIATGGPLITDFSRVAVTNRVAGVSAW